MAKRLNGNDLAAKGEGTATERSKSPSKHVRVNMATKTGQ